MKRIIYYIITILLIMLPLQRISALTVSEDNIKLGNGKSKIVKLTTNQEEDITKIEFNLTYSTYDIPAYFNVNSKYEEKKLTGIKHSITFTEPVTGLIELGTINIEVVDKYKEDYGEINITSAIATTSDGDTIKLKNANIVVNVINEDNTIIQDEEIDYNLLDRIESKITNIELEKDVFEYTITIDKNIKELDLVPIAKEENTNIEIKSQAISDLTDNVLEIKVSNGNIEQIYKINIEYKKDISNLKTQVDIDNTIFKENNDYKNKWKMILIPLGVLFIIGLIINKKKK